MGTIEELNKLPEYRRFEEMLKRCPGEFGEKGQEFADNLRKYALQFAQSEINEDELRKLSEGEAFPLRQWINTQSIIKRWKLNRLLNAILTHLFTVLMNVIIEYIKRRTRMDI
jgi:hypothetical protein